MKGAGIATPIDFSRFKELLNQKDFGDLPPDYIIYFERDRLLPLQWEGRGLVVQQEARENPMRKNLEERIKSTLQVRTDSGWENASIFHLERDLKNKLGLG